MGAGYFLPNLLHLGINCNVDRCHAAPDSERSTMKKPFLYTFRLRLLRGLFGPALRDEIGQVVEDRLNPGGLSIAERIRQRGRDPVEVFREIEEERRRLEQSGVIGPDIAKQLDDPNSRLSRAIQRNFNVTRRS